MTITQKSAEHLEEVELNKLLKYLFQNGLWNYYLFVKLGVSTALRFSDLSQIKWDDVINKTKLLIREKKTNKVREIPISPELMDNLKKIYFKLGSPDMESKVIPIKIRTVNKQIKIYAWKAGIRKGHISSHSMRKTFAREIWRRNNYSEASLIKLSQLFNHSSISITRIYLNITREEVANLYSIDDLFVY